MSVCRVFLQTKFTKIIPRNTQEEQDCVEWLNPLSLRESQHRSFIYSWTFFTHVKVTTSWLYSRVIELIFRMKKTVTRLRDTSLYKLYRFLQPHRVGFLRRFGLKTGIRFAHFGQGSGMVSKGNDGVDLNIFFCFRSNLCNYNIISA